MNRYNGVLKESEGDPSLMEAYLPNIYETSHAANLLQLDNDDILCAWFSGSGEGNPDTNVIVSRLNAGSTQWAEPIDLSGDPKHSEQNPVLFQSPDGKVWLFHTSGLPHREDTAKIIVLISDDRGNTWEKPKVLFDSAGAFIRHPLVILKNGSWILPVYYWDKNGHYSAVKISPDEGKSWEEFSVDKSRHRVQMNIIKLDDTTLLAYFRSRQADRIYSSLSKDMGKTWTAPKKTILPNNNSSTQSVKLESGNLIMVYNDATLERDQIRPFMKEGKLVKKLLRTPLTIALSEDKGKTWPFVRNIQISDDEYLENQMGYSYPSVIQAEDGKIHIAYTYLRKGIKHVILDEEWIKSAQEHI